MLDISLMLSLSKIWLLLQCQSMCRSSLTIYWSRLFNLIDQHHATIMRVIVLKLNCIDLKDNIHNCTCQMPTHNGGNSLTFKGTTISFFNSFIQWKTAVTMPMCRSVDFDSYAQDSYMIVIWKKIVCKCGFWVSRIEPLCSPACHKRQLIEASRGLPTGAIPSVVKV